MATTQHTGTSLRRSQERGFSITELSVSLALLSVISLIFFTVYVGLMQQSLFAESHNDMTVLVQRALNDMHAEILQSRTVFQNDTAGNAYLTAVQTPTAAARLAGSKLPTIAPNGRFKADTIGDEQTGNVLFLARQQLPLELALDDDNSNATPDISYLTDNYRFEVYYLSPTGSRGFATLANYVDLIKAQSFLYADYFQLSGLGSTQRTQLVTELFAAGVKKAWDPSQGVASALYTLNSNGTITGPVSASIAVEKWASLFPQFRGGSVTGRIDYTVGSQSVANLALARDKLPYFALASGQFPGGFELQIVGPTGARRVYTRLMLMAKYQSKVNTASASVTTATEQF